MTYDWGGDIEVAIGTLDNPNKAAPVLHVNPNDKLPFVDELHKLPVREEAKSDQELEFFADNTNYQHPDHDT